MVSSEISPKDYKIIASIMKDGPGMRHEFTYKQLFDTLNRLGFTPTSNGWVTYDGKALRVFADGKKGRAAVSFAKQDELKRQMYTLFGWTKGSFVEHSRV